jgi:predicted transcriptional regulator
MITDYHLGEGELGTDVIAGVREQLHSEVKAVLVTGDTSDAIKHLANDPRLRILSKPIDAEQLLMVLKELLSA